MRVCVSRYVSKNMFKCSIQGVRSFWAIKKTKCVSAEVVWRTDGCLALPLLQIYLKLFFHIFLLLLLLLLVFCFLSVAFLYFDGLMDFLKFSHKSVVPPLS